jgi:hypothetical protein
MEFPELKLAWYIVSPSWAVVGKVKYQVGTIRIIVAKLGSWWARKISGYAVPLMVVGVVRPIYALLY